MSNLKVFRDGHPEQPEQIINDKLAMAEELAKVGIRYEQWQAVGALTEQPSQEEVLDVYRREIDRLIDEEGYQSVDVVSMTPEHPQKQAAREKFLEEHSHSEDEVRFFVDGQGPNPNFTAIRLFNNPEGWVANFTGSDIAQRFNRLEN